MNTKIIIFSILAALFVAASVGLYQLGRNCLALFAVVVAFLFVLSALAYVVFDLLLSVRQEELLKSKKELESEYQDLIAKVKEQESRNKSLKAENEALGSVGQARIAELEQKNKELLTQLQVNSAIEKKFEILINWQKQLEAAKAQDAAKASE